MRRRDADAHGQRYHAEIDHIVAAIDHIQSNAEEVRWQVDLGNGWEREAGAVLRDEAAAWYDDPNDLRVLCNGCKGGSRAAGSSARHIDTSRQVWWIGDPYEAE